MIVDHVKTLIEISRKVSRDQTQTKTIYPAFPYKAKAIDELIGMVKERFLEGILTQILDVGACDGYLGRELVKVMPSAAVYSCDCSPKHDDVYEMALPELPFADSSFDAITARHCLEHSITLPIDILELRRVLRDDGFLFVVVPDIDDENGIIRNHENHVMILPREAWRLLFSYLGFEVIADLDGTWEASRTMKEWRFVMKKKSLNL